jgi:glycosyltransferase involved in cell wall biosynthesis
VTEKVLPADDPKEFAERVFTMLRDRNFRSALAIKARAAAKANYTWESSSLLSIG